MAKTLKRKNSDELKEILINRIENKLTNKKEIDGLIPDVFDLIVEKEKYTLADMIKVSDILNSHVTGLRKQVFKKGDTVVALIPKEDALYSETDNGFIEGVITKCGPVRANVDYQKSSDVPVPEIGIPYEWLAAHRTGGI